MKQRQQMSLTAMTVTRWLPVARVGPRVKVVATTAATVTAAAAVTDIVKACSLPLGGCT